MASGLVLSPAAINDLDEIVGYYHLFSPETARRYFDTIIHSLRGLTEWPERGRIVPEFLAEGEKRYRQLIIEQFRAIYRLDKERILVIRIVDGRRLVSTALL